MNAISDFGNRVILVVNIWLLNWQLSLYRYQVRVFGPSHRLDSFIAEWESDLLKWQIQLRYL